MPLKDLFLILIFIALSNFVSAGAWTKMADFGGATGRHRAIGLSIGNKGYIGTGHFNGTGVETYYSDWWEYDPATNAWSQKADYIGNSGLGDLGLLSIEIPDINVGYVGLGELDPSSLYKYDPATNSWSQVSDFPNLFLNF
ncbi:MAG: N-acetylneuraminic acid mutarotase, partial [Crocinitomicaceae bacterium]